MSTWSLEDSFFFRVEKVSSSILEADKSCLFVEPVADVDEFDLGVFDMTGVLIPVHYITSLSTSCSATAWWSQHVSCFTTIFSASIDQPSAASLLGLDSR
jgi:hypothetical protein